jgi:hypothetical protein
MIQEAKHSLTCNACSAPGPLADNRGVARFRALNAGWSTARGRELCVGCTARHNAALPSNSKEQASAEA